MLAQIAADVPKERRLGYEYASKWWTEAQEILDLSCDCSALTHSHCVGRNLKSCCPQNQQQAKAIDVNGYSICPQNPQLNHKLRTISRLHLWMTHFWGDNEITERNRTESIQREAVIGLQDAVVLLDQHWAEPLDLSHGRDRLLIRFFLARAIFHALSDSRFNQPQPRAAQMRVLARQARLAILLLTKQGWSEEAIENLIYVMADYGHEMLYIPRKLRDKSGSCYFDLAEHLWRTLRGESALHTLKAWYRDHFFHTVEVCLIGFALLRSHPQGKDFSVWSESITQACRSKCAQSKRKVHFVPESNDEFMAQWWIAALVHDTAYGIDVLEGTLKLLSDFGGNPKMGEFVNRVRGAVADMTRMSLKSKSLGSRRGLADIAPELKNEIKDSDRGLLDESILDGDHGVISAADLAAILPKIDPKRNFTPAIRAIAFHNTRHPRVSAATDPVAALLILCDTIQDWGRSQLGFKHSPALVLSRLVSSSPTPKEEQFGPVERFSFSLTPRRLDAKKPHCHDWQESNVLVIQLDYNKRATEGYGIFYSWVDMIHNLRRVSFPDWENIEIRIRHRYPMPSEDSIPMIDRLLQIAPAEKIYIDFVKLAKLGDPKLAVKACRMEASAADSCKFWDVMEFNLYALSLKPDLLGKTIKEFVSPIERDEQIQMDSRRIDFS